MYSLSLNFTLSKFWISIEFSYLSGYPFEHNTIQIDLSLCHSISIVSNLSFTQALMILPKSDFNFGIIVWHSGSPILTLYSIKKGSLLTIINPA